MTPIRHAFESQRRISSTVVAKRSSAVVREGSAVVIARRSSLGPPWPGVGRREKKRNRRKVVPGPRIELGLPCENQILSLARLPIPPSRQDISGISTGCDVPCPRTYQQGGPF